MHWQWVLEDTSKRVTDVARTLPIPWRGGLQVGHHSFSTVGLPQFVVNDDGAVVWSSRSGSRALHERERLVVDRRPLRLSRSFETFVAPMPLGALLAFAPWHLWHDVLRMRGVRFGAIVDVELGPLPLPVDDEVIEAGRHKRWHFAVRPSVHGVSLVELVAATRAQQALLPPEHLAALLQPLLRLDDGRALHLPAITSSELVLNWDGEVHVRRLHSVYSEVAVLARRRFWPLIRELVGDVATPDGERNDDHRPLAEALAGVSVSSTAALRAFVAALFPDEAAREQRLRDEALLL